MKPIQIFTILAILCLSHGVTRDERIAFIEQALNDTPAIRRNIYTAREVVYDDDTPSTSRAARERYNAEKPQLALHHIISHNDMRGMYKKMIETSELTRKYLIRITHEIIARVTINASPDLVPNITRNLQDLIQCLALDDISSMFSSSLQILLRTDEEILNMCRESAVYIYQTLFYHLPFNLASGPVEGSRMLGFANNVDVEILQLVTHRDPDNKRRYDFFVSAFYGFLRNSEGLYYLSRTLFAAFRDILEISPLEPPAYDRREWCHESKNKGASKAFSGHIAYIFKKYFERNFINKRILPNPFLIRIQNYHTPESEEFIAALQATYEIESDALFFREQAWGRQGKAGSKIGVEIMFQFYKTKQAEPLKKGFYLKSFLEHELDENVITTTYSPDTINEQNDDGDDEERERKIFKREYEDGVKKAKETLLRQISVQFDVPLSDVLKYANSQTWEAVISVTNPILPIISVCLDSIKHRLQSPQHSGIRQRRSLKPVENDSVKEAFFDMIYNISEVENSLDSVDFINEVAGFAEITEQTKTLLNQTCNSLKELPKSTTRAPILAPRQPSTMEKIGNAMGVMNCHIVNILSFGVGYWLNPC